MAAIISVLNSGSVAQTLVLQEAGAAVAPRTLAIADGCYLLAGADGSGVPEDIVVKRSEMHLLLVKVSDGSEQALLTIEDFFLSHAQLFGLGVDGNYHLYGVVVGEARGASATEAMLKMTVTPAFAEVSDPLVAVDGSVLSPAAALEQAAAVAVASAVDSAGSAESGLVAAIAAAKVRAIDLQTRIDLAHNPVESNGDMPM